MTLLLEFLGGVALLAVAAWIGWTVETRHRSRSGSATNAAATRKLRKLQQDRDRRFDSGMDRTKGVKR